LPGQRRIYVSGTASIAPGGETVHPDDAAQQVKTTMEVVRAILTSREMDWEDVTRAIGYFKHGEDAPLFARYCQEHGLPDLPVVIAKNDICRDELLFEVEVDAAGQA
jgi:enamine deaminase RidA (YjgF/YER057c/UK114 family)